MQEYNSNNPDTRITTKRKYFIDQSSKLTVGQLTLKLNLTLQYTGFAQFETLTRVCMMFRTKVPCNNSRGLKPKFHTNLKHKN